MSVLVSWLERRKASLCILAGICAVSLFVITGTDEKINENTGGSYVIKIRHYGIDAAEMERSVTIPLEDALFSIHGVQTIQSSSENSLSSVFIRFRQGIKGRYEAVRDAAQRVYETLPSSAQRPEILSSNNSRIPVWSASIVNTNSNGDKEDIFPAQLLEKLIKPRLESLDGAGEVLVSGIGPREIIITFDQEKLEILGLEPSAAASFLRMNDSIFSGGSIQVNNREINVTVDSRYEHLSNALIPVGSGNFIKLSEIAHIKEHEREPDIISRLNGRSTASIAVMGQHNTDLRKLSSDIKKELAAIKLQGLTGNIEFIVLSDLGAEETAAFRSVLSAALSGAIMVAIISFLLNRKYNSGISGFFCALVIPLICLISAAILSIFGFSPDRLLLAGIAAGVGTAIDAVILCSEKLRKCSSFKSASLAVTGLTGPLVAGGATTAAALIPLFSAEDNGIKIISSSIAVVTITALVLSLTLLPPLLLWRLNRKKTIHPAKIPEFLMYIPRRISRFLCRILAITIRFCTFYPRLVLFLSLAITISAVYMLITKGVDTGGYSSEDSIYAQVEFDGGLLAQEVDHHLAAYSEQLLKIPGIRNVETSAKTGSGSVLVSFDPKMTQNHIVRDYAKQIYIPGGFVFFHDNSKKDRSWEIFIYGDEDRKCREIAEELAFLCANHPLISERMLNFKQGSKKMILIPDREIFSESGISFAGAASRVRLGVFGPVAYKRIDSAGETDVRIMTANDVMRQSRQGTMNLLVPAGNRENISSVNIDLLMQTIDETEPSSIRRDNRRRFASITISTKPMDPRHVKNELDELFKKLDLPPGYSIEFDPDAIKQSEKLSAMVLSLIMAVIFCYMIIASVNESFNVPLLVLSAVPPSLAIPALFLFLSGGTFNSSVACAFIAVSGMTVNAAILCVDGIKSKIKTEKERNIFNIYPAIRSKIPALLATAGTTIAGAIPFLFLTEGANTLIRTLSLVGALGVASSCLCSVTVIPSLLTISKISLQPFLQKNLSRLSGI